jgi:glycosyltransferase involved in cell wall biosynthesis
MARILYLTDGYTVHDRRFLEKLAKSSHEIYFQPCREDGARYESRPVPDRVKTCPPLHAGAVPLTPLRLIPALGALRRRLKEIKPDLIHAGPVPTGGFLAAASGFHPLLIMSWGSDVLVEAEQSHLKNWMSRFALRRADMALADCQAVRDKITSFSPLTSDDIVMLPWGIELNHFSPRRSTLLRERLGWENSMVLIGTRGFERIHAPLVILEAFASVSAKHPEARLLLLGAGSLQKDVEAFIAAKGLKDKVHLTGRIPNDRLPDFFAEADLYVSGTLSDGTSISLLEAMASGLPAIVVDAFGNREWVKTDVNGWLYPPGEASALADVLSQALARKTLFKEIGERNIERVRQDADWHKNFSRLLTAYNRLLGGAS